MSELALASISNARFSSSSTKAVDKAIVEVQKTYIPPAKTAEANTGNYHYKYATLAEIIASLRELLTENGLWFSAHIVDGDKGLRLRTVVYHAESSEYIGTDWPIFADRQGAQGFASGVSYARRYGLLLTLGIVAEDDDDATLADGRPAQVTQNRPKKQPALERFESALAEKGLPRPQAEVRVLGVDNR